MDARNARLKRKASAGAPLTPTQQAIRFVLALVAIGVLFMVAVRYFAERRTLDSSAALESRGLYLKLAMGKSSYGAGEPVTVSLDVRNISDKEVKLDFPNDLEFDLTVQSELDLLFTSIPRNIWQYSAEAEHLPRPRPHSIKIAPGATHHFKGVWRQLDYGGKPVKPGRYIVTGLLKSSNYSEILQVGSQTRK